MSDIIRPKPHRRSSNSSVSSRTSNVSFSEKVRRESTAKFDNFMKECRAAYLAVLSSTTEKMTSIEELTLALQFGGRNPSKKIVQKYWRDDTDNISYNDFCDIMRKEKPLSKDSLLKAFKRIDVNGDGFITHDELFKMLTTQGERMTKLEVQSILYNADENGDGKLDYMEFCKLLVATAEDCKQKSLKKLAVDDEIGSPSHPRKSSLTEGWPHATDSSLGSPRVIANRQSLEEPKNLKDWNHTEIKGSFFIDEDGTISSHQFKLHLPRESLVWLTVQPTASKTAPKSLRMLDVAVFCVNDKSELVAFTECKLGLKYCLQCKLGKGTYNLITFTTGCWFHVRKYQPSKEARLTTGSGDTLKLTKPFREALVDIFNHCDLDGNGYLSRQEFDLFQMRSSGDTCDDDAWEVMKENFEMKDEEIALKGFLDLNMMEAQDSEGDPNDLWVTLECMGYNKALELDQSCPFVLEVFSRDSKPTLKGTSIAENRSEDVEKALIQSMDGCGVERVRGMKDLMLHKYKSAIRVTLVIDNQSHSDLVVQVDCSGSKNCVSHRGDLDYTMKLDAHSTQVAHHLVPQDFTREWFVKHSLTIEK